jgi:hypothetical protein
MKRLSLIFAALLFCYACERAEEAPPAQVREGRASIEMMLDTGGGHLTRSSCGPNSEDEIHDINVWLYQDGALFPDFCLYSSNLHGNKINLVFPSINGEYSLYFLANTGEIEPPEKEAELLDFTLNFDDYSSFKTNGFPMAAALLGYKPQEGTGIHLEKLVGRFDIYIYRNPANKKVDYSFTSGRLKACAKTVRPWGRVEGIEGYASRALNEGEVLPEGDYMSEEDIEELNTYGTVTLYYLENCQGCLLPDNTLPRGKNAQAIETATGDAGRASLCSYLELICRAVTPTITYENVIYRVYLGQNGTSDFSIKRGSLNNMELDLVSDRITESDWFVEPGEGTITGQLLFTETDPFADVRPSDNYSAFMLKDVAPTSGVISSPSFYLQNNLIKTYYIYCSDSKMDYTLSQDIPSNASPYVTCNLEKLTKIHNIHEPNMGTYVSKYWKKLTISTECTPESFGVTFNNIFTLYEKKKTVNLNVSSYDGVINVPVEVGVIGSLEAKFNLNTNNLLQMAMFDPIGYTMQRSNIGIEAFTAGSHYWYSNYFLDYDSPFWAVLLKRSSFDSYFYNTGALISIYKEKDYPMDISATHNTLYNTLYLADSYTRKNKKKNKPEYAEADLVYGRINTLEITLDCPKGYSFKNSVTRNIPVTFRSTANLMNGKFGIGSSSAKWEGIYVFHGKNLEYSPSNETRSFVFETNYAGQGYTLNLDGIYNLTKNHGSAYRDPGLQQYGGTIMCGVSSGQHEEYWWVNYPFLHEDYYPQTD